MAVRAPRVCGHCGSAHQAGERCSRLAAMTKERKARADRKRPSARERGYDAQWEKARAEYLAVYSSCRRCGQPATEVDHIIPIRKAPHRRLDRTNFQSLCRQCHAGWKQAQDRRDP